MFLRWLGDRIGWYMLIAVVFCVPLFALPLVSNDVAKMLLLTLGFSFMLIGWILTVFTRGITIPKHFPFVATGIVFIALTLATVGSPARMVSLVGDGFQIGTLSTILFLLGIFFFTAHITKSWQRLIQVYMFFMISFVVLIGFELVRYFSPTTFSNFLSPGTTLAGSLQTLGILSGVSVIFILITLELRSFASKHNILLYGLLGLALAGMFLGSTLYTWIILALSALAISMYSVTVYHRNRAEGITHDRSVTPYASIFVICLTFILLVGGIVGQKNTGEGVPTWSATFSILGKTLTHTPFLGEGLNRFTNAWQQYKPKNMVLSSSWQTDFSSGVGFIPTFAIAAGIVGSIAWLYFLIVFLKSGIQHVGARSRDNTASYFVFSAFLVSLFLWAHSLYGPARPTIIILTFIFTGLFFAALSLDDKGREVRVLLAPTTTLKKICNGIICFLCFVFAGTILYFSAVWFEAHQALEEGKRALVAGDISKAETFAERSIALHPTGDAARLVAKQKLTKLETVLSRDQELSDTATAEIQLFLNQALSFTQKAKNYDPTDYRNAVLLAQINESVMNIGIEGPYKNAQDAYAQAIQLNPTNPELDLLRARLEVRNQAFTKAQDFVDSAIKKKSNYADAWFLLSQLQANQGMLSPALTSVQKAVTYDPGNFAMLLQLGILQYRLGDYQSAADVLSPLVVAVPSHANARYFLGLSYYNLNQVKDAIDQFSIIQATNPDNPQIKQILDNLKAGRKPL